MFLSMLFYLSLPCYFFFKWEMGGAKPEEGKYERVRNVQMTQTPYYSRQIFLS